MNRYLNYIAKSFPSFIKQTIRLTPPSYLINSLYAIFGYLLQRKVIFAWLLRHYNIIIHVVILNIKIQNIYMSLQGNKFNP